MGKRTSSGVSAARLKLSSPRSVRHQVTCTTRNVVLQSGSAGARLTQVTSHIPVVQNDLHDLPDLMEIEDDDDDDDDDAIPQECNDNLTEPSNVEHTVPDKPERPPVSLSVIVQLFYAN